MAYECSEKNLAKLSGLKAMLKSMEKSGESRKDGGRVIMTQKEYADCEKKGWAFGMVD